MTYGELLAKLERMEVEELGMDVTVFMADAKEFFGGCRLVVMGDSDVLDEGHPVIVVKESGKNV